VKRLLKEPLVHFVVLGALLFGAYAGIHHGRTQDKPRQVRVTGQEIAWLQETWVRQWQRPPTEDELKGLVTAYLKEELLAREARELGLDQDDTIVRRRLAQKMEFLLDDTSRAATPTDAELRRWYEAHLEQFQDPAHVSFTQVFFRSEVDAQRALANAANGTITSRGDSIMLERDYAGADEPAVAGLFGREFAGTVFGLQPGKWQGPIPSGYGFHLVYVSERGAGQRRPFDGVRAQVLDDWHREQKANADEQFFAGLLKKYDVVVEESIKPLVSQAALARDVTR
jgi:hypothetical protein